MPDDQTKTTICALLAAFLAGGPAHYTLPYGPPVGTCLSFTNTIPTEHGIDRPIRLDDPNTGQYFEIPFSGSLKFDGRAWAMAYGCPIECKPEEVCS